MRKYSHGYITIPADKLEEVNKAVFDAGLGINFFNIPLKDDGKNLLYGAIASLNQRQWAVVNRVLKEKLSEKNSSEAVKLVESKPTKASWELESKDRIRKAKESPGPGPDPKPKEDEGKGK